MSAELRVLPVRAACSRCLHRLRARSQPGVSRLCLSQRFSRFPPPEAAGWPSRAHGRSVPTAGQSPLSALLSPRVGRGATASTVLCSITGWVIPGGL